MTLFELIVKVFGVGLTLYFIIDSIITPGDNADFSIWILKVILVFIALPALYLFKLLAHFEVAVPWRGGWMSGEEGLLQTKLFYVLIYTIISILVILKIIELAI